MFKSTSFSFLIFVTIFNSTFAFNAEAFDVYPDLTFIPFDQSQKTSKIVNVAQQLKFTLKSDGLTDNLVGYLVPPTMGLVSLLTTQNTEKGKDKVRYKINYIPSGPNFPFRFCTSTMNGTNWLNLIKDPNLQRKLLMAGDVPNKFLNAVSWNNDDLQVVNQNASGAVFVNFEFDNPKKANIQLGPKLLNMAPNDDVLKQFNDGFASFEASNLSVDDVDALYANEMGSSIDNFLSSVTSFLENEGTDEEEINTALQKLRDLKPKFNGVFKTVASQELEVLQTGDRPDRESMVMQPPAQISMPDSRVNLKEIDIMQKRHGSNQLLFKTQSLSSMFQKSSSLEIVFFRNLSRFNGYFNEFMGPEATLYFAALDTHLVKSNMNKNLDFYYLNMFSHSMEYMGDSFGKDDLIQYLVTANSLLLKDIFIEMQVFWGRALYGREFLNLIYDETMTEMKEILEELMNALQDNGAEDAIEEESADDLLDSFRSAFSYGPFFLKLKEHIQSKSVELASAFFEAKKEDPLMAELWGSPSAPMLLNTFFTYSSKMDRVVYPNTKNRDILPTFMYQYGVYEQNKKYLMI